MTNQNIKALLSDSFRAITNSDESLFATNVQRFINQLSKIKIASNFITELEVKFYEVEPHAQAYIDGIQKVSTFNTNEENSALSWFVIKKLFKEERNPYEIKTKILKIVHYFNHTYEYDEVFSLFVQIFVEPFYNFIIYNLTNSNITLSFLIKYKHKIEWFHKENYFKIWEDNTQKGEEILSYKLYEYLFDQGVDFHIEPKADSGRPDLIESQTGTDKLIADVKIFNPGKSKGKSYIINAFNQIYTYAKSYNNSIGYLVIFKTCENELCLNTSGSEEGIHFITFNSKTIFFIIIDIFVYNVSASKRGKLETITIEEKEFTAEIKD
ncbi:hypothetical protein BH10BAC5_BH10BAC5_24910 [soil metagenome]